MTGITFSLPQAKTLTWRNVLCRELPEGLKLKGIVGTSFGADVPPLFAETLPKVVLLQQIPPTFLHACRSSSVLWTQVPAHSSPCTLVARVLKGMFVHQLLHWTGADLKISRRLSIARRSMSCSKGSPGATGCRCARSKAGSQIRKTVQENSFTLPLPC